MTTTKNPRVKVGELRPSQVLTTFGIGSIVDLPNLSVMVMGLDDWDERATTRLNERRLLAAVRNLLGPQVESLNTPPMPTDVGPKDPLDKSNLVGIPVAPFPRWMVCTFCRRLAPLSSGLFELKSEYSLDRIRYVHRNCTSKRPPAVVPARFIVACENGHLDDFPWHEFVHGGNSTCLGQLKLNELSATGEAARIQVICESCGSERRMSQAFGPRAAGQFSCHGRHPHLRLKDADGCKDDEGLTRPAEPMLQGATNAWFPMMISVLAVPEENDELTQLVCEHWANLVDCESQGEAERTIAKMRELQDLQAYPAADVWKAIETVKSKDNKEAEHVELKAPEWQVFTHPGDAVESRDFKLREVAVPTEYRAFFERVVLADKLREVRALVGFTRIGSPSDFENPTDIPDSMRVRLSRKDPLWVPASETRGEGIFIQFNEKKLSQWEGGCRNHEAIFREAHRQWRTARGINPPDEQFPGIRFILLHSFAHSLLRQLAVECGYSAASLKERIYSRVAGSGEDPMAGVLIYTAAPDSEGTLGGLVSLGEPSNFGQHLSQALDAMRLCASDPLCAEHHPHADGQTLHGASCHSCLFVPETACERGNKYLDRSVLVRTVQLDRFAFFE